MLTNDFWLHTDDNAIQSSLCMGVCVCVSVLCMYARVCELGLNVAALLLKPRARSFDVCVRWLLLFVFPLLHLRVANG